MTWLVERVGHHGDGIIRGPDGPIYAAATLAGEEVDGVLSGDKLTDIRIITPSVDRVKPPCTHARVCGGCMMQHASDGFVAGWKEQVVAAALAGQGISAPIRPIVTSPPQSRRRATLTGRKTKTGAMVGFHARGSDTINPIPNCKLLSPALIATIPALEAFTRFGGARGAEVRFTVTLADGGPDVAVEGGKPLDAALQMELARMVEGFGLSRLTWNGEPVALRHPPYQRMGKALVAPPSGAFLQATSHGEASLISAIREALGPQKRIIDLFAGCGTFTFPLSELAEVHAVEGEAPMIAALDRAARETTGLHRISHEVRDLFRRPLEPDEFKGTTAVVIDPPRAGAEAQMKPLALSRVPRIAMVSCNPVTFARDARVLIEGGYTLLWVQPVDQFRWSSHIDLAAAFAFDHKPSP